MKNKKTDLKSTNNVGKKRKQTTLREDTYTKENILNEQ